MYAFLLTQINLPCQTFFVDDHDALQFELEALEDDLREYGVYAEAVNVVFDVEELPDSDDDQEEHANDNVASKSKDLTNIQRRCIYQLLL